MDLITNQMDVFAVRENSNRLQRLSAADIVFFFQKNHLTAKIWIGDISKLKKIFPVNFQRFKTARCSRKSRDHTPLEGLTITWRRWKFFWQIRPDSADRSAGQIGGNSETTKTNKYVDSRCQWRVNKVWPMCVNTPDTGRTHTPHMRVLDALMKQKEIS